VLHLEHRPPHPIHPQWRRLREQFPDLPIVVAGDLNMNLGGQHYYGTARGRRAGW